MSAFEKPRKAAKRTELIPIVAFAVALFVGTVLLVMPFSSRSGQWTEALTALFTVTSATCVTGLTVVDTATYFSHAGQIIILCLIQVGGMGIMTLATFFLVLAGRRISLQSEFALMESWGHEGVRSLWPFIKRVIAYTLAVELAGAAILSARFAWTHGYPWPKAVGHGLFHSVSGFCNAGFALYSDNLVGLRTDKVVVLTLASLIFLGGIGFIVLCNAVSINFWQSNRITRGRLTLHSKLALTASAGLIIIGWLGFLAMEWHKTLLPLQFWDKIVCSLFQSVTPRTAGYNVVDMGEVTPATLFMTTCLMFVGGSPASTAGGIKTTTLIVLLFGTMSMIRGREETEVWCRCLPVRVVKEALSVFVLGIVFVGLMFGILLVTEHVSLLVKGICGADGLLFETVSAFGTVGLSVGITPKLSVAGKLCIILCMLVGKLGPLTVAMLIGGKEPSGQTVQYPKEEIVVA